MSDIKPTPIVDRVPFSPDSQPEEKVDGQRPFVTPQQGKEVGYMDNLEYHRVADFLEIGYDDRKSPIIAQKLSFLYDWAGEVTKSEDRITRLETIRGLQRQLGIQDRGIESIKKIYQYARLDQDRRRIEREIDLIK